MKLQNNRWLTSVEAVNFGPHAGNVKKWVQVLLADVARFTIVYGVKATVDGITA